MRKGKLVVLALGATLLLAGCGGGSTTSSPSDTNSASSSAVITGISISGPSYVFINRSVSLEVFDNNNNPYSGTDVNWTSSDPTVASVNENGTVLGISEGNVTISASLKANEDLTATFSLAVRANQASDGDVSLTIDLEENEFVTYENGVYNIPIGREIKVEYSLPDASYRRFDGVSYSFPIVDNASSLAEITVDGDGNGIITALQAFDSTALTFSGSYSSGTSGQILTSILVSSYDHNAENQNTVLTRLNSFIDAETDSLTSASYSNYVNGELNETLSYEMYMGESYVSGDTLEHSIYDPSTNSRYYYAYDNNGVVTDIYVNDEIANEDAAKTAATKEASLAPFRISGANYFGFSSVLLSIATETTYRGYPAFGDSNVSAHTTYTFTDSSILMEANYTNYAEQDCILEFEVNYVNETELTSYCYTYSLEGDEVYQEVGFNFVYQQNKEELRPTNPIDISTYLISSFDVVSGAGNTNYEYTDLNRYGGSLEGEYAYDDVNNIDVYTIFNHKALVLLMQDINPTTGSLLIDPATVSSTYEYNGSTYTREFGPYEREIFAISAPKDDNNISLDCEETLTITTDGGGSYSVKVVWVTSSTSSISISIPTSAGVSDLTFPSLYPNQDTYYFYLSASPESGDEVYYLDIVEGDENGLELRQYEDDNVYGYPGFAYYLHANSVGTYKFRLGLEGYVYSEETAALFTDVYTIEVMEPLSDEEIEENILSKSYVYFSGNTEFTINFDSSTSFIFSDGTSSETFAYHISNGLVYVDEVRQFFTNEESYFESILGGEIFFNEDYSNLTIYLRLRADVTDAEQLYNYSPYSFRVIRTDFVGYETTASAFLYSPIAEMCNFEFSFSDISGVVSIRRTSNSVVLATIHFDYTYSNGNFSVTQTSTSDEAYNLVEAYAMQGNSFRFRFNINSSTFYIDLTL